MEKEKFVEMMGFADKGQIEEYICDRADVDGVDELDTGLDTKFEMVEFIYESNLSNDPSSHVRRIMQDYKA